MQAFASHPSIIRYMQEDDTLRFKWLFLSEEVITATEYFKHTSVTSLVIASIVAPRARYAMPDYGWRDQMVRAFIFSFIA